MDEYDDQRYKGRGGKSGGGFRERLEHREGKPASPGDVQGRTIAIEAENPIRGIHRR